MSRCFVRFLQGMMLLLAFCLTPRADAANEGADGGFLFVTFRGERTPMSEQIYFAVSEDGRKWEGLKGGEPTVVSQVGERGVRDPYLVRSPDGKKFFLIATDLSIHFNRSWGRAARNGSKCIVVSESEDLVKWSEPRLVKVAPDDAGCTWAPEATFDEETGDYLVFWASTNASDRYSKFRIWAARTKDFITFTAPFIYIEHEAPVIDTTIVREGKVYYRFTKDEGAKAILMEKSDKLTGEWQEVTEFSLRKMSGYEGPTLFPMSLPDSPGQAKWCLLLDYYSRGAGYKPFVTTDLSKAQFEPSAEMQFPFLFRHGHVLPITNEEMARLKANFAPLVEPSGPAAPATSRPTTRPK